MTRLDRTRLEACHFPFQCEIPTRYADLDLLAHVNNVAAAEILQEARLRFLMAHQLVEQPECTLVVVGSYIEFATELLYPQPVQAAVGVIEIGRSSFRYGQIITQNGRIGAYAECVQVAKNRHGAVPLPTEWRTLLEGLLITALRR